MSLQEEHLLADIEVLIRNRWAPCISRAPFCCSLEEGVRCFFRLAAEFPVNLSPPPPSAPEPVVGSFCVLVREIVLHGARMQHLHASHAA